MRSIHEKAGNRKGIGRSMKYELKNDNLTVSIESFGAELTSILDKNGTEYLWCGDSKFWGRHSPVLFPVVGKPRDGKFTYEGKEYAMGQHGFARDMEFTCTKQEAGEIWFQLEANEETLAKYPFAFGLEIGYRLSDSTVKVMWKVTNREEKKDMHFSIGAHPAFMCPLTEGEAQTDYSIVMDATDKVDYYFLNAENGLLADKKYELKLENGSHKLVEGFFDESAYVIENSQVNKVALVNPQGKEYITVTFDAPLVGIWSPEKKNAPFVCIEPWYGRCDKENFNGTLEEREWSNKLAAGEVFEKSYDIRVGVMK